MLAILVSWTTIFFILFSFGDILTSIYNRLCRKNEAYGIIDSFFLGLCFILIPLQFTSLWLPSGHYMLFAYIIICILYWIYNRKRLKGILMNYNTILKRISLPQTIAICIAIISVILFSLFLVTSFDSDFYHYQHIRWNEEYPVIPGLGNFEDRYGFNSNYFLLSAIFSFRFIFTDAVYTLQGLIFTLLLSWAFVKFFLEKSNISYLVFIILLFTFLLIGKNFLDNTSTDIIPHLCILYYIVKTVTKPQWLKDQSLFAFILPVTLITFKLSTITFCIVVLVVLIYLMRDKNYKAISFLFSFSFLIVVLWCVRNVIITGYLVYPVYAIDLFSFDWKMPKVVLMLQKKYIHDFAMAAGTHNFFDNILTLEINAISFNLLLRYLQWIIYGFFAIFPILIIISFFKKLDIDKNIYFVYLASIISFIFVLFTAPDFRFFYSYAFGCAFISFFVFITLVKGQLNGISKYKTIVALFVACCFFIVSFIKKRPMISYFYTNDKEAFYSAIYVPLFHYESSKGTLEFTEYKLGNHTIYMKVGPDIRTFDVLPATNYQGLPDEPFTGGKIQSIKTIEARGNRLEDGFRTKKEYIDSLNMNTNKYIKEYRSIFDDKH